MAPELGLFLDECFFDAYNAQWGELHGTVGMAPWAADADAFKVWAAVGQGWGGLR